MHLRDGTFSFRYGVNCADDLVLVSDIDMQKGVENMAIVAVMIICIAPKSHEEVVLGRHGSSSRPMRS